MSSPLHELHHQADAEFQLYAETEIVSTFGEPQAEYAAIRKGVALIDQSQRAILEVTGRDRLSFLNNLVSNQTWDKATKTGMPAGSGVNAFLLNAKSGRIVADLNVIDRGDRTLLEMDARLISEVREALMKYRFAEQVEFAAEDARHQISVHGPQAAALLDSLSGQTVTNLGLLASTEITLFGVAVTVWRDDPTGSPGYHLLSSRQDTAKLWANLLALNHPADVDSGLPLRSATESITPDPLENAGFTVANVDVRPAKRRIRPIGWAAFNAARIEGGRPMFGIDFDDTILPAETGQMPRAVSFTKGCYPGQEIVARMHARKAVAKLVIGLKFADDALPIAGAPVTDDQGNTIGGITSSTISPMLSNIAIAIALLKRPFFAPGTVVNVPAEGAIRRAVVTEIPFLKSLT